jgi:hypothetical protein
VSINLNETTAAIRKAGAVNVRVVPMKGQTIDGEHQIEIQNVPGTWQTILTGIKKPMAESIVRDATNRVLLG